MCPDLMATLYNWHEMIHSYIELCGMGIGLLPEREKALLSEGTDVQEEIG